MERQQDLSKNDVSFNIYVPSYKRSEKIVTRKHLEYCTYVVRESEKEAYEKALGEKVLAIPDEVFDNGIKNGAFTTFKWIIENTEEEVICIIDDDIEEVLYRLDTNERIPDADTVMAEIERLAQMVVDLEIGYACIDGTPVPYGYDAEFGFKGVSGGIRWINKSVYKAKFDKNVQYNFDLDIVLQELLLNRVILKPKYLCTTDKKDTNSGGASSKKRQDQLDSILNMKRKWKSHFEYNEKKNVPKIAVKR